MSEGGSPLEGGRAELDGHGSAAGGLRWRGRRGRARTTTTTAKAVIPISNDACLSCHTDFSTTTKGEDPKKFSHDLHLGQRIACSTCHQTVGHGGMPTPPQQVCDDCHGLAMPHPDGFGTAHGKQVVEQGGEVCARCHNVYLHCQECHGLQMPHPEQWTQKHGKIAYPQMQVCVSVPREVVLPDVPPGGDATPERVDDRARP